MVSEDTTTVRVRRRDSKRLQSVAKARRASIVDVVHSAIDAVDRGEFIRGLEKAYQNLPDDPERWKQYGAERHEWDRLA